MFHDWNGESTFDENSLPLLYKDMDDFSASILENMDLEKEMIKKTIERLYPKVDLSRI